MKVGQSKGEPLRKCKVLIDEKEILAYFHRWEERTKIVPPSPMVGGNSGGLVKDVLGIVELEDGSVQKAAATSIKFLDSAVLGSCSMNVQAKMYGCPICQNEDHSIDAKYCKICGEKIEKAPLIAYQYEPITELPHLLSEVFVTVSGGVYYKARLLGYGAYNSKDPSYKTYCVEVLKENGRRFVDFFRDIYSRKEINETEEGAGYEVD